MPSPAALDAARVLLQVDRAPSDERLLSIAGSGVGCAVYPSGARGRADAETARAAIAEALVPGMARFLGSPDTAVATAVSAGIAVDLVLVEERQHGIAVLVCGIELPGPEPLGAHLVRRMRLIVALADELDRALAALTPPADVAASTLRRGDALLEAAAERAVSAALAQDLAEAQARIEQLLLELDAARARGKA